MIPELQEPHFRSTFIQVRQAGRLFINIEIFSGISV